MTCLDDSHGFLLVGFPIALLGYLAISLGRMQWLFNILLAFMMALCGYAALASIYADVWDMSAEKVLPTMFAIMISFFVFITLVANVALMFASLTLLTPFIYHNAERINFFLSEHGWNAPPAAVGTTIFFIIAAAAILALHYSGLLLFVASTTRIVITSALVTLFLHLLWIERVTWLHASVPTTLLCCTQDDASSTCPLALDNILIDIIFILLLCLATACSYKAWRRKRLEAQYVRNGDKEASKTIPLIKSTTSGYIKATNLNVHSYTRV